MPKVLEVKVCTCMHKMLCYAGMLSITVPQPVCLAVVLLSACHAFPTAAFPKKVLMCYRWVGSLLFVGRGRNTACTMYHAML